MKEFHKEKLWLEVVKLCSAEVIVDFLGLLAGSGCQIRLSE